MAVRFIDTGIWDEDWFCELGSEYQNFWTYITCECDNAGIWKPNKISFEIKSRTKINLVAFLQKVNEQGGKERILILESGRWFLTGFIAFQWFNKKDSFDLALSNKLHKHIYELLVKQNVDLKKIRGLKEVLIDPKGQGHGKGKGSNEILIKEIPVISETKGWNTMPGQDQYSLELPEIKVGAVIQLMKISRSLTVNSEQVLGLWETFKIQCFTGKKFYAHPSDAHSHFMNWVRTKDVPLATITKDGLTARERHDKEQLEKHYGKTATKT